MLVDKNSRTSFIISFGKNTLYLIEMGNFELFLTYGNIFLTIESSLCFIILLRISKSLFLIHEELST